MSEQTVASGSSFVVAPALDVLEGRCVRLVGGDPSRVTIEGGDPGQAAARFAAGGASLLHLVDLDGAFSGSPTAGLIERIARAAAGVPVQVGGGFRTLDAVAAALTAGAARVIVGTAALEPAFLADAVAKYGDRLVVALDARDGSVAVAGWRETADLDVLDHAHTCAASGVARLLVTSTGRDGSLAGPDLDLLKAAMAASELPVMAAGGIASLEDVRQVRAIGCEGVVLGSALWSGRVSLADALRAASEEGDA